MIGEKAQKSIFFMSFVIKGFPVYQVIRSTGHFDLHTTRGRGRHFRANIKIYIYIYYNIEHFFPHFSCFRNMQNLNDLMTFRPDDRRIFSCFCDFPKTFNDK